MWNLIKWISSPSKKEEEAAMRAARHHAREGVPTAHDSSERENHRSGKDVFSAAKTPDVVGVRRNAMAYWRKNTNAERPSDLHYYTSLTSPAGYNWQNPFLADAASSNRKQAASAGSPGSDLSSLSAFLTINSKNYLAGMHARKSQNELQGQEFESLRSGENLNPSSSEDFTSYPHYQGGWEAENARAPYIDFSAASDVDAAVVPECGVEEIIADETVAQTLAAKSAQTSSLFLAAGDALSHHMDISFAPSVDAPTLQSPTVSEEEHSKDLRTNHAWTVAPMTGSPAEFAADPQSITEELTDSLNSIESSPQCDLLFAQSAAAAGAIFPGARPMRPLDTWLAPAESVDDMRLMESINDTAFDERDSELTAEFVNVAPSGTFQTQSQAEQSTTLDNLPEQQFVDVRIFAADSIDTAPEILKALAYDINPDVRFAIAENHNVDAEILSILAADDNPYVAHRARKTLQRLEGGQLKKGNFVQTKNPNWLGDRRKSV
jgi:hypothetical protein